MSDKKISELPDGDALQDTDLVPVARSGVTFSVAGSEFGDPLPAFDAAVGALWSFDPATGSLTISSSVVDLSLLVIDSADETYEFTDDGIVVSGKDGASGSVTVKDTPVDEGGSNGGYVVVDGYGGVSFNGYGATDTILDANGGGFNANFRGDTFVRLLISSGGVKFPTEDPHISGAWWDDAGTLTKSTG